LLANVLAVCATAASGLRLPDHRSERGCRGISDFNALHSGRQNDEVQLCAFDVLALDGEDLRALPLSMRKANLAQLLRGRPDGIHRRRT
jgi:ATP-dependent DNA ligase